jgi:hypothetical protein
LVGLPSGYSWTQTTLPSVVGGRVKESSAMFRRRYSLLVLIYVLVGIYVAFAYDYITARLIRDVLSALLAIFLWWLVLLDVSLHIR